MPFLADEHDGFQAALTFVDEYVSSSSEFDEEPETRHQSAASESAVWRHHRKQPVIEELLLEQDDDDDDDELFPLVELISEDMDGVPSSSQRAVREAAMAAAGQPIAHPPASPQKQRLQQQQQPPHQAVVPSVNKSKKKSGPKKPITWNPNKARDERKQELLYLRKQVVELETQLQVVQKKKPRTAASPYQIVPAPMAPHQRQQQNVYAYPRMLPQNNPAVACVWKEVASRQSEERIKSERENIRLKIVLENQIKIAKSLESILTKRASTTVSGSLSHRIVSSSSQSFFCFLISAIYHTHTQEIEKCLDAKRLSHIFPTSIDRTDIGTFEDLLAGVEQSYAEVDAVLEANGLAQIEKTHSNAQLHTNTGNGMFLEIFASKVLPFGIHSTASAVWHHFVFAKERQPQRHYYNKAPKVSVPEICSYVKVSADPFVSVYLRALFVCLLCRLRTRLRILLWRISTSCCRRTGRARISRSNRSCGATTKKIAL